MYVQNLGKFGGPWHLMYVQNLSDFIGWTKVYVEIRGNLSEVSSITAILYAPSQVFEHFIGHQFCAVLQTQTCLQFALIPPSSFLCTLEVAPWKIMESENLQISVSDTDRFDKFTRHFQNIKSAIKNMNSKPRNREEPEHDDSEDSSSERNGAGEKEY